MSNIMRERLLWLTMTISLSLGLDQTTKRIAEQNLGDQTYSFFFDTIRLLFIKNSGAFLGLGSDYGPTVKLWLFFILPGVFLCGAIIFTLVEKNLSLLARVMISLMVSGGIGNLIDRIFLSGQVTDFINMGIGPLRTGIFNIADVAIMIGAIGLVIIQQKKVPEPENVPLA